MLDTVDPSAPEIAGRRGAQGLRPVPGVALHRRGRRDPRVPRSSAATTSSRAWTSARAPKDYRLDRARGGHLHVRRARHATPPATRASSPPRPTSTSARRSAARPSRAQAEPAPQPSASGAPRAPPATSAPAPAPATTHDASERSERREQAARPRARSAPLRPPSGGPRRPRRGAPPRPRRPPRPLRKAEKQRTKRKKAATEKLAEVGKVMAKAAGVAAEKTAFPVLLLGLCGLFLVAQDRVDRRDPSSPWPRSSPTPRCHSFRDPSSLPMKRSRSPSHERRERQAQRGDRPARRPPAVHAGVPPCRDRRRRSRPCSSPAGCSRSSARCCSCRSAATRR